MWLSSRVLPKPSGPYAVGFTDYEWIPSLSNGEDSSLPAYSLVRIYYPSGLDVGDERRYGRWIPSYDYLPGYGYYLKIPRLLSVPAFKFLAGSLRLRATENAPLLPPTINPQAGFPVILFSHGLAGIRTTYSTTCTDLASHGYVVAAVEHRMLWRWIGRTKWRFKRISDYFFGNNHQNSNTIESSLDTNSFRDGSASLTVQQDSIKPYQHPLPSTDLQTFRSQQLSLRSRELSSALDLLHSLHQGTNVPDNLWRLAHPEAVAEQPSLINSLKGRLLLDQPVAMGHSFGAATALFAASRDPRFHAVVAMDPWMYPLPSTFTPSRPHPLLVINSETFHWPENMTALRRLLHSTHQLAFNGVTEKEMIPSDRTVMVTLRGTGHMDQSDFSLAMPPFVTSRWRPNQTDDPELSLRTNNDIILAFLKEKAGAKHTAPVTLPSDTKTRKLFEEKLNVILDYPEL